MAACPANLERHAGRRLHTLRSALTATFFNQCLPLVNVNGSGQGLTTSNATKTLTITSKRLCSTYCTDEGFGIKVARNIARCASLAYGIRECPSAVAI